MRAGAIFTLLFLSVSCVQVQKKTGPTETEKLVVFLDQSFDEFLDRNPEWLTALGQKKFNDRLNDYSEAHDQWKKTWVEQKLTALKSFDYNKLDGSGRLNYDLAKKDFENMSEDFLWKDYGYPFNQQYGTHTELPSFMMNMHAVDSEQDLRAYIARLIEFRRVFQEVLDQVSRSEKAGIVPPKFVFPYVISSAQNVIKGKPFDDSKNDSPLLADFKKKMIKLQLGEAKNAELLASAEKALKESVLPAYQDAIKAINSLSQRANKKDGVWKFPNGSEFYRHQLKHHTTTTMTADQIHKLGLENVKRIHADMKQILKKMNYKGSLQSFFKKLREDKQYYYPNTDEGRKAYLDASKAHYAKIHEKIPQFFRLLPKAGFEIRAVEKFREDSAGVAFYEPPSEDGSRPGVYYVNLKDMHNLPKYEAEAILYHEGAPGHHFQIALAQEMKSLPKFRRFSHVTAYVEGWGLYTERLAKEMGAYTNDLSEFGRLSAELLRAARLVVDTGIHSKQWSREKAIQYFKDNLPSALDDQKQEIERYIVMPGQATAYMVGKLKFEELRQWAQKEQGSQFDIRDFHDLILGNGAMPLGVLENRIKETFKAPLPAETNKR